MSEEQVYKIVSFLLIPFTLVLALVTVFGLFAALLNPVMIIVEIMWACVLGYSISSAIFFWRNIAPQKQCSLKIRTWIVRCGFVTILFLFNLIIGCVDGLTHKNMLMQMSGTFFETWQKQMKGMSAPNAEMLAGITSADVYNMLNFVLTAALVYALILLLHLLMTYKFLRKYRNLFSGEKNI